MRCFLLLATLAACTYHAATSGPAWPKTAATTSDGGESLAPHVARREITAIERSDDDNKPTAAATPTPPAAAAPTGDAPAAAPSAPASQPIEDVITTDDIIIEIDD